MNIANFLPQIDRKECKIVQQYTAIIAVQLQAVVPKALWLLIHFHKLAGALARNPMR